MKKKRKQKKEQYQEIIQENQEIIQKNQEIIQKNQIKKERDNSPYHAPKCHVCLGKALVYHTSGNIRYCKCTKCGWTFKG